MFVSACHNVCKRSISINEINASHDIQNMHLHLHLKNCLLDYGPVYAFWCFSYERFNGILGAYHVNNHVITIQLMRKCTTASQIRNTSDLNFDCFLLLKRREKDFDTHSPRSLLKQQKLRDEALLTGSILDFDGCIQKLRTSKLKEMQNCDFEYLSLMITRLYPNRRLHRISRFVTSVTKSESRKRNLRQSKIQAKRKPGFFCHGKISWFGTVFAREDCATCSTQ